MHLKQSDLFTGLGHNFLKHTMAIAEKLSFKKGDFILKGGEPADYFFILIEGQISLLLGDPGAYMDRTILESNPHQVLEGIIACAYAVGAHKAIVYIRAEYPLAVRIITDAIHQAQALGLVGKNILGSSFDLEIEVFQGSGALVCGEETALISSIEGLRGMPIQRPPYPVK
jgi:NADH:ubiquinone oxidoreductase subunit F (NADH-binding)